MILSVDDPVLGILLDEGEWKKQVSQQQNIMLKEFSELTNFQFFEKQKVVFSIEKHNAGATYHDLLLELHFDYEYKPELLEKLVIFNPSSEIEKLIKIKIILQSFVAFYARKDLLDIATIINCLFSILKIDFSGKALNALAYIFSDTPTMSNSNIKEATKLIQNFFFDFPEFAKKKQSILVVILRFICSNEKQESDFTADAQSFIMFICKFAQKHLDFFEPKVASDLIYCLIGRLVKLDDISLHLFYSLSPFIDDSSAMSITMLLPMSIRDMVESQPPFLVPKDVNGNVIDLKNYIEKRPAKQFPAYKETLKGQYTHPPRETFKSGIDIKRPVVLTDKPSCACLLRPDIHSKLLMIGDSVKTHQPVVKALFEWISQTVKESSDSPHFFDLVAIFIFLFRLCMNKELVPLFWDTMYNTQLFDPRVNIFDESCTIPLFDQLRAFIFSDVANNGFSFLPAMVKSFLQKPELVAEMFRRIIEDYELFDPDVLKSSSLVTNTCSVMVYFQILNFNCPEDQITLVESTRSVLLAFILQVLSDPKIACNWFSCRFFLTSFLALVFEPVLRKHVLGAIMTYLVKGEGNKDEVMNEIIDILNIIFPRFPDSRDVQICCDIIEMINNVMSLCKSKMNTFINLKDSICGALINLDSSKTNDEFLIQALHYLAIVSPILKIKSTYLQSITEAIKVIEKSHISPQVLINLKQISAGNVISSVMPFYVIKQPKALKALINITKNTETFGECIAFLLSLVEFTYQNSIIMNNAGIDMLLLEIVDSMKGSTIDSSILDNIFSLISNISMIVSSTLVVHRFISLMFPLEGRVLSQYYQYFMKKLNEITARALRSPSAYIPVHSPYCVVLNNVTQEFLGDEFRMCFWLYIDRALSQAHAQIIEIFDHKIRGINVFISSGSLLLTCFGKRVESTTRFDVHLPKGEWCFTSVLMKKNERGTISVQARVNEEVSRKIDFNSKWLKPGPLKVNVGHMVTNGQADNVEVPPILLSSFSIVGELSTDEIKSEIEAGPRATNLTKTILSLKFSDHEGTVRTDLVAKDEGITAEILGGSIECNTTFIDVLCSLCKVKALIPLFSMFDLKTKDGKTFPEIPILIIDLFTTTLSISEGVQKSFYSIGGMEIISYLIQESKTFPHNYAMYVRLYAMMNSITERSLQVSVIKYILCDFTLLMMYDATSQLRIVKHWRRIILQEYPAQMTEVMSISTILNAMNTYFEKGPSIEAIRQELRALIVEISTISVNENDILALVSEAISTNKMQRVKETLKCLSNIFSCEPGTCVDNLKFRITHIVLLNNLISTGDDEVLLLLTNIIASVHALHLLPSISPQMHFELIMQNITPKCCSHDSAVELATMTNNFSISILPLCLYVSINVDDSSMFDVFETLRPQQLSFHEIIWVIAAVDKSPSDIRKKGLNFLINCKTDYRETINAITIVCTSLCSDPHSIILEYLTMISSIIKQDAEPHEIDEFFTLAIDQLFFHTNSISSPLQREFRASPFDKSHANFSIEDSSESEQENEGSFQQLRARSMMSRSFIFISGEDAYEKEDEIEYSQETVTKSLSESCICTPDVPKIKPDQRKFSYDKENEPPPPPINESSNRKQTSPPISPKSQSFLYRPPIEAKLGFSMNDLYSKIESFAKNRKELIFSIRRDKNGRWFDIDLALLCLKLYTQVNTPLHLDYMILAADILLHYQPVQTERFLKSINPAQNVLKNTKVVLSMLKFDMEKMHMHTEAKFMSSIPSSPEAKCDALNALANSRSKVEAQKPYRMAEIIMKDCLKMVKLQSEFISYENAENIGFSMKESRKFIIQEKVTFREQQRMWSRLWNTLTMKLALWEGATQKKTVVTYTRDYHLCSHFAPVKEKYPRILHPSLTTELIPSPTSVECTVFVPAPERKCLLEITRKGISITTETGTKFAPPEKIRFILPIERYNGKFSVEIILSTGKVYIFEFPASEQRERIMQSCRTHLTGVEFIAQQEYHPIDFLNAINATEKWTNGEIPNFEYLMLLNIAAGRTFADRNLYPIFPWVIVDFHSKELDFDNQDIYRDLRKPIGAMNDERITSLLKENGGFLFKDAPLTGEHIAKVFSGKQTLESIYKKSEENNFELPPEFFFYTEFVSNNIELPPWATSAKDFVYKHREALESILVSATLHFWIDNVFGVKANEKLYNPKILSKNVSVSSKNGIVPQQIFTKNHVEKYQLVSPSPPINKEVSIDTEIGGIVMSHITSVSLNTIDMMVVLETGLIKSIQIDVEKQKFVLLTNTSFVSFLSDAQLVFDKSLLPSLNESDKIVPIKNGFASTTGSSPIVGIENKGKFITIKTPSGFVRSLSSDGNHVSAVCTDMTTRVWEIKENQTSNEAPKCAVSSYRDYSICSAVSESFGVVVTGTRDGSLQICNLSGSVQKVINLAGMKPLKMIISKSFGFIVVYAERTDEIKGGNDIIVYTINGLLVGRISTSELSSWVSWEDYRGIDYLALAFSNGKLQKFEIGSLTLSSPLRVDSTPVSLEYSRVNSILVSTSRKGSITLIPVTV